MLRFMLPALLLAVLASPARAELIAWYPFEETSGTTLFDQSGNWRNLTYLGSNTLNIPGVFGRAANVDTALARTGNVSASTIASLNTVSGNQATISFWARPNSENIGSNPFYISDSNASAGNRLLSAHLEWTDGNIYWDAAWNVSSSNRVAVSGGTVSDRFHHYVFVYDGVLGDLLIFKDNVLLASNLLAPGGALNWAGIRNFELGSMSFVNGAWRGDLDDFAIYNEILTANERNTLFTRGVAQLEADRAQVPEPSSLALFGLFGVALAVARLRSR